MKVTISIPDKIYKKLEEDRGSIPRSTYIQDLIKGDNAIQPRVELGESVAVSKVEKSSEPSKSSTEEFKTYFKKKK